MNNAIDEKLKEIFKAAVRPFEELNVRVECPLDSGVKVVSWSVQDGKRTSQSIPGGVRSFFLYVRAQHSEHPKKKFNVVEFKTGEDGKWTPSFLYDEEVQKEAEENVK